MRRITIVQIVGIAVLLVAMAGVLAGCTEETGGQQRSKAVRERSQAFNRATRAAPTPIPSNFPLRKALVEFTERQDLPNHPWYVYIIAQTGNPIGYYVAKTVPINACNFLSSTQDVRDDAEGNLILTAPSLDGMFYGGAGASSGCDAWFFFDVATDALIQIRGVQWFSSDQPLRLDVKPIRVER